MGYYLVPIRVSRVREDARHGRRGVQALAGHVGSGGRPRRRRAMRVRGPWRSRGGVGGPAGGRRWP